jgi:hypothetical protein
MGSIKEEAVKEFLSNIDFKGNWSLNYIKDSLQKILGEFPAVDIKYKKDVMLNEATKEAVEIHEVHKVAIVFMDTNDKFNKVEIIL